jgi:hypothetical protein
MQKELNVEQLDKIPSTLFEEIKPTSGTSNKDLSGLLPETEPAPLIDDFGRFNAQSSPEFNAGYNTGQNLNAGSLISAKMAVNFTEMIVPALLVMAIKNFAKKTVSKKQFKLDSSEKETLEPVLQNYLNSINFSVENPLNALMLTLVMIYGTKTIEVINDVPAGKFQPGSTGASGVGEPTAAGTIKKDGRGRPKGTFKKS